MAKPRSSNSSIFKLLGANLCIGAGYVQQIGSGVQNSIVGDSVLLSFQSCASCKDCKDGHPSYCQSFSAANYGGEQELFQIADGGKASGFFFGQSSFSSYAIVKESSVVKVTDLVDNEEQLKLFAPLGCGFQTGIGTVDILTAAGKTDAIVILGLGGVGLSAIMVWLFCTPISALLTSLGCQNQGMLCDHWG